jgi:hypothetical protein
MAQQHTIGTVATSVATGSDGVTRVIYHSTIVAAWNATTITLDSGGWRTATTKTRINQAASQYALDFRVFQSRGDWYVDLGFMPDAKRPWRYTVPFTDGMIIRRDEIHTAGNVAPLALVQAAS